MSRYVKRHELVIARTYQVIVLGSVLLQQRIGRKVRGVTTRRENDRAVLSVLLAVLLVLDADDLLPILEHLRHLGLLENLDTVRRRVREVFKLPSAPVAKARIIRTFSMRAYVMVIPGNWAPPRCVLFSL